MTSLDIICVIALLLSWDRLQNVWQNPVIWRIRWHEHEISCRTWFNQENSTHSADSAIRTNTAHKQQLQKMGLADFKIFPLVSVRSVRGWKNVICLLSDRKSPQNEGILVDLSNLEIREHFLYQDLYQQVFWHLPAAAFHHLSFEKHRLC